MMSRNGIRGVFGASLVAAVLLLASGCSHPDAQAAATAPTGPEKSPAEKKADAIKAIQANPHMPEQVKANIIRQLNGGPPIKEAPPAK